MNVSSSIAVLCICAYRQLSSGTCKARLFMRRASTDVDIDGSAYQLGKLRPPAHLVGYS